MFIVSNMDYKSRQATYIGPESPDYESGKDYEILIQEMLDGRYAVFKSSKHYNEAPGYKVFKSLDEVKQQFKYESTSNAVR